MDIESDKSAGVIVEIGGNTYEITTNSPDIVVEMIEHILAGATLWVDRPKVYTVEF